MEVAFHHRVLTPCLASHVGALVCYLLCPAVAAGPEKKNATMSVKGTVAPPFISSAKHGVLLVLLEQWQRASPFHS